MELWVSIKNYEGLYEISNFGRVKSLSKNRGYNYSCRIPERIIKNSDNGLGYQKVNLSKNGKKNTKYVHILVATYFIENTEDKLEVNHKDGNKANNIFSNLEWATRKENESHAWKSGLKNMIGKNNHASKPVVQMDLNGNEIKTWESSHLIEKSLNIYSNHVRSCCKGKLATAYGFKWKYAS